MKLGRKSQGQECDKTSQRQTGSERASETQDQKPESLVRPSVGSIDKPNQVTSRPSHKKVSVGVI